MHLIVTSAFDPNKDIVLFSPPGHRRLLIQVVGKFPQDGIPYDLIPDLLDALRRLVETYQAVFKPHTDRWALAAAQVEREINPKPEDFIPYEIGDRYGVKLITLETCAHCGSRMTDGWTTPPGGGGWSEQMRRAGWKPFYEERKELHICVECAKLAEVNTYECALCHEKRGKDEIEFHVEGVSEILCTSCYETVTAQEWERAKDVLLDRSVHYGDF